MARKTEQREVRLVSEYMAQAYRPGEYAENVPLGPALEELVQEHGLARALEMSRPWRPRVDAVAWPAGRLVLIEGKVRQVRDGLGHLAIYRGLVDQTPELAPYRGRPLSLVLLTPWVNDMVLAMATGAGVQVEVFAPVWIQAYVEELHLYWTREYQEDRARRLALRELLGLE